MTGACLIFVIMQTYEEGHEQRPNNPQPPKKPSNDASNTGRSKHRVLEIYPSLP